MGPTGQRRERYRIGDLLLDVGRVRLTRAGAEIPLPRLSFRLLVELARAAPDVVGPDELLDRVWDGVVVHEETLKQRVKLLRHGLGESGRSPVYVRTVRGMGYQLIPDVESLADESAETAHAAPVPMTASPRVSVLRRLLRPLGLGALGLTLGGLLLALSLELSSSRAPAAGGESAVDPLGIRPDSAAAFYAVGRRHFRDRRPDALALAREAFEQAVRIDRAHAAAWAGLSDVTLMGLLYGDADWAASVEASARYLHRAEVAGGWPSVVAASRGLSLWMAGEGDAARLSFEAALRNDSENHLARLWLGTLYLRAGRLEPAREQLEAARAISPLDPVGLTNLGETHMALGRFRAGHDYFRLAEQVVPDLGLLALRAVHWAWEYGELEQADQWIRRALAAGGDPHGAFRALRAQTLMLAGDPAGARRVLARGRLAADDPEFFDGPGWAVQAKLGAVLRLAVAERRPEAIAAIAGRRRAVEPLTGWTRGLASAYYLTGDFAAMITALAEERSDSDAGYPPLDQAWLDASLAVAHIALGQEAPARHHARVAIDASRAYGGQGPRARLLQARLAALQGNQEQAFENLAAAVSTGWLDLTLIERDPVFSQAWGRPAYRSLRADLERRRADLLRRLAPASEPLKLVAAR